MMSSKVVAPVTRRVLLCGMIGGALPVWAKNMKVVGAGATFPARVYEKWAEAYGSSRPVSIEYEPTGSGDGVDRISQRKVLFGGTDVPLSSAELDKHGLLQIPTMAGAVVPVFNLPGVKSAELRLTGELLADLFMGRISQWNDQRIAVLNPGLRLPALPVRRVVRSDKSGSTHAFAQYLAMANPVFANEVGVSKLPKWPGEVLFAKGSSGVVKRLKETPGSLSFTGLDRVRRDDLRFASLRNRSGAWVAPSEAAVRAAVQASGVHKQGDDTAPTLDMPGPLSWPISLVTFVLFDRQEGSSTHSVEALQFFYWAFTQGDKMVNGTGFSPLPALLQARTSRRMMDLAVSRGMVLTAY